MAKAKTNFTYVVGLEGGAESGPLSLVDIQPMLREGKITGGTFVKRSDREEWSTAADFPELKIKDDVGGVDNFQANALTQELEKELYLRKVRAGVSWLFWIGALSLLNSGMAALGIGRSYAMGLGAAHLIAALGDYFGDSGIWVSLGANLSLSFAYLIVGVLAYHGRPWLLGPAIAVYVGDAILCLLFEQWLSVGLHGLALFFLIPGFIASYGARGLPMTWHSWASHGAAAAIMGAAGFGAFMYLEADATPEPTSWAATDRSNWPLISVAHAAEFKEHTPLDAGNAFFIKLRNGQIVAATARHLLGSDGGVEPAIKLSELDSALAKWKLKSRATPEKTVSVSGLHGSSSKYGTLDDWVLLKVAPEDVGKLPAEPLSPRLTLLEPGETVFVAGSGVLDSAQEIHEAKVLEADDWTINAQFEKPIDLTGYSGSPLIDERGNLVGILTGSLAKPDGEGKFPSFIAESVLGVKKLLR